MSFLRRKYSRCMYWKSKHLYEKDSSSLYQWTHLLDCLCFVYGSVRLALLTLRCYHPELSPLLDFLPDLWFVLATQKLPFFDRNQFAALLLGFCLHFTIQRTLYLLPARSVVSLMIYDLFVLNQDAYQLIKSGDALDNIEEKVLTSQAQDTVYGDRLGVYQKALTWLRLANVDRRKLFPNKLVTFPSISIELRWKMLLLSLLADQIALWIQIGFDVLTCLILAVLLPAIYAEMSFRSLPLFILDTMVLYHSLSEFWPFILFFGSISVLYTTASVLHLKAQTKELTRFVGRATRRGYEGFIVQMFRFKFDHFLTEHYRVSYLLEQCTRQLIGKLVMAQFIANLPVNVYLVCLLRFKQITIIQRGIYILVILTQWLFSVIVLVTFATATKFIHNAANCIVSLQQFILGKTLLRYKLKYDDLLLRLLCGPKIAATVGPVKEITYRVIAELILYYVAFLLLAFSNRFFDE